VALNAPKPDEGPSGVRGNRDEAMTVRQHEPVWELNPIQATLLINPASKVAGQCC